VLDPAFNPDLADIGQSYLARGHLFVVAEQDGVLIGTGGMLIAGGAGQIVRVSVAHKLRGQGIGRRLVMHLVAAAQAHGLPRVWMETNDDWQAALALYTACGFREFDRREGCVFMERRP
jgi:ribosomal protein S18 acetylase RimI-like enzyme